MSKIYLALKWENHIQVTRPGGKKVIRDEIYTELVEKEDFLQRLLGRIRSSTKNDKATVDTWYKQYHADVKKIVRDNVTVSKTFLKDGRKVFTYHLRPLKLSFDEAGATYTISKSGKIYRTPPKKRDWYNPEAGKVHSGLSAEEAEAEGIVRGKIDTAYTLERIEARAKQIEEDKSAKDAPFSVLPKDKAKGKAKSKGTSKPKPSKQESGKSTGLAVSGKVLTKRQQNECDKFDLNPDSLPKDKPKGMNGKIWKALTKAV